MGEQGWELQGYFFKTTSSTSSPSILRMSNISDGKGKVICTPLLEEEVRPHGFMCVCWQMA